MLAKIRAFLFGEVKKAEQIVVNVHINGALVGDVEHLAHLIGEKISAGVKRAAARRAKK